MKILAVCGNGLGSSFMLSLNVKKALTKLGISAEVANTDLATAKSEVADYFIGSPEIIDHLDDGKRKVIRIKNLLSATEIEDALKKAF